MQDCENRSVPAQKSVAFFVALEFQQCIYIECFGRPEFIDLYRVINDQLRRLQRINKPGIAAQPLHRIAHGSQINHCGTPVKSLQEHAARRKSNFLLRLRILVPGSQRANFTLAHIASIFSAQQVLEQNAKRNGKCRVEIPCLSRASIR